jgi:outer membrane biogenesis lipoprotein LolB
MKIVPFASLRLLKGVLIVTALCAAVLLSGCADFQARMEAQRQAKVAAENADDDAQCRNYGAMPGTHAYTQCRMMIAMQRKDIEAARDLQIQQNSAAMMMTGTAILSGR